MFNPVILASDLVPVQAGTWISKEVGLEMVLKACSGVG
jgi:hypothetical protein